MLNVQKLISCGVSSVTCKPNKVNDETKSPPLCLGHGKVWIKKKQFHFFTSQLYSDHLHYRTKVQSIVLHWHHFTGMRQTLTFWVLQVLIPELNITVGYRSISGHRHHMTAHIEVATDPTSRRLILSTWLEFWPVTWSSIFVHSSISRVSTKQGEMMARRPIRARAVSSCTKFMCFSVIIMFPYQGGFPVHVHVGPCVFPS